MNKAAEFEMPAVAMTDHGKLFGAIEFYQEAQRAGVKPIIGCEVYVAPGSHKDRPPSRRESAYHFTLLAENETGYRNLVKLVTAGHLDGFHYAPRIDKEMFARLKALGNGRPLGAAACDEHRARLEAAAAEHVDVGGGRAGPGDARTRRGGEERAGRHQERLRQALDRDPNRSRHAGTESRVRLHAPERTD
jgi:DNA polymerase III alpha subunit